MDVIVQRWQTLSGKKATLDGDGRTFEEIAAERRKGPHESRVAAAEIAAVEACRSAAGASRLARACLALGRLVVRNCRLIDCRLRRRSGMADVAPLLAHVRATAVETGVPLPLGRKD